MGIEYSAVNSVYVLMFLKVGWQSTLSSAAEILAYSVSPVNEKIVRG